MTIESLLFAALGFLLAGLLTIVTAPLLWARAVRLTTRDIKSRMALTEREIEADRGRMRAEHAVLVHGLESRLATLRNSSDSARVEINRRDARISQLTRELQTERDALETSENARRVLERTIVDRVPDVERHLRDARAELAASETEAQKLRAQVTKTVGALDEALEINDQQRAEIGRLKSRLSMLEDDIKERDAIQTGQPRTGEGAVRAELAALRAKSRDQANLIERLQRAVGNGERLPMPSEGTDAGLMISVDGGNAAAALNFEAAEARQRAAEGRLADRDRQIRVLEAEVAALRELATQNVEAVRTEIEGDGQENKDDARSAPAHAAVQALEDAREERVREQEQTIKRLRAELAAANDRLARELAKMKDELRRYSQNRSTHYASDPGTPTRSPRKPSLTRRVTEDVPEVLRTANANGRVPQTAATASATATVKAAATVSDTVTEKPVEPTSDALSAVEVKANDVKLGQRLVDSEAAMPVEKAEAAAAPPVDTVAAKASTSGSAEPQRRGLLARISEIDRRG